MFEINIPYWSLSLLSGLIAGAVTIFALRARQQQGANAVAMLMAAVTLWSFGYAAELGSTDLAQILFLARVEYMGIVAIPPFWLYFAFCLNPWEKLKNKKILYALFIIPAITFLLVWTNDFHHLFWMQNNLMYENSAVIMKNTYGPVFWVHFFYSYLLIIGGTILLFYRFLVTDAIRRYRFVYLLIPIFPLLANALPFVNLNPFEYLDLTPFAFTISGLMLVWGASRKFHLEIVPIAYDVVFENIEDGFIITDHNSEVVDLNPAVYKITGFSKNEEIQALLLDNFRDRLQEKDQIQVEVKDIFNRPYVLMRITPLYIKNKLAGRLITLTDITQQKQAAKELEELKERYETIFTGMRDAILIESFAGQILDVNPSACEMFGYRHEEFMTKNVHDLVPKGAPLIIPAEDTAGRSLPVLQGTPLQTYNLRADGKVFPVEVGAYPLVISGESVLLVVVRDITEKVKAEAALKSRERHLQLLNKITWDALTGQNLQEMLQTLADRLGELFEASGTYITLWDDKKRLILPGAAYGPMRDTYPKINPQPGKNTMTKAVLESGQPIITGDIYNSPYVSAEISLMFPARSVMALPMITGDRKLGAALIAFDNLHDFSEEDIHIGSQAADQIALSISRSFLMQKTQELLAQTRSMNETLEQRVHERTEQLLTANRELEGQIIERQRAEAVTQSRLEAEKLISNLSSKFMDSDNFDTTLVDALKVAEYITGASRTYIFMLDPDGKRMNNTHEWCSEGIKSKKENLQNLSTADFPWWMAQLHENRIIQIEDITAMLPEAASEQKFLQSQGIRSLLCYPIFCGFKLTGFFGLDYTESAGFNNQKDTNLLAVLVRTMGSALYRKQSEEELKHANEELRAAYDATIEGWARALELREKETAGHSERTMTMALRLARKLNIDEDMLEHIRRGALLHDIGKMVIPDHILQKPGALTAKEWEIIREHPLYSKRILGHIEYLAPAVAIPFYHHEKWDGSGYPEGLKGEEIPLPARLFALVDVWDALSSDRPYHKAIPQDQVIVQIEKGIGMHFDPVIAKIFIDMLHENHHVK